ncbi:TPA: hypothetical protein QCU33_005438 [Bacillus cereus]|nr:hypothetical protein [Bacillus cereus]
MMIDPDGHAAWLAINIGIGSFNVKKRKEKHAIVFSCAFVVLLNIFST